MTDSGHRIYSSRVPRGKVPSVTGEPVGTGHNVAVDPIAVESRRATNVSK